MELQFQPGTSSLVPRLVETATAHKVDDDEPMIYSGYGTGGKLRKSRRDLKRPTPYDRPAPARHATGVPTSSGSVASSSSLASRLVGSASRVVASSLSYLFPSLFGRRILSLPQSNPAGGEEAIVIEQKEADRTKTFTDHDLQLADKTARALEPEQILNAVGFEKPSKKEFDLECVEDMLKRKVWSRDQVSRLTEILSTRLTEEHPTIPPPADVSFLPSAAAANKDNTVTPISEAQRWREELKRARTDCVPVEVAKAYMGDRTSLQSSFTQSFRASAHQLDRIAELQPPPGLGLIEDRYRPFPVLRSRTRGPAPLVAKKGPLLDEEWMSVGPVRRTRHKLFHMNSSPYARSLPAVGNATSGTYVSPPMQSRQTAQKILDTLEVLSPFPTLKHKHDESMEVGRLGNFSSQGSQSMHQAEVFRSSARNLGASNGRLEFGSPMKFSSSTLGTKKDTQFDNKSPVHRLLPSSEFGFFSTSTSLLSSSAAATSLPHSSWTPLSSKSGPIPATQSEIKASFAFTLPPFEPEGSQMRTVAISAPLRMPSLAFYPRSPVTSVTTLGNTEVALPLPSSVSEEHFATDGLLIGQEKNSKIGESDPKDTLTHFQFRSPSVRLPFTFNTGTTDSSLTEKGSPSAPLQDDASGVQPDSEQRSFTSTTTSVLAPGQSLFASSPDSSLLLKVSGKQFGATSVTRPSFIAPLTVGASSAPFSFSPQPLSFVSCPTPTFSFGSSAGSVSVPFEAASTKPEASNASLVFNFTAPSLGPELPLPATEEPSLPAPSFSFGSGLLPSSSSGAGSDSTFCFGSGISPSLGGSAPASTGTGQMSQTPGSLDSIPQPSEKFGEAQSSPFHFVEHSQVSTGLDPPASFSTGASVTEKAGRKFVKVKRKK